MINVDIADLLAGIGRYVSALAICCVIWGLIWWELSKRGGN